MANLNTAAIQLAAENNETWSNSTETFDSTVLESLASTFGSNDTEDETLTADDLLTDVGFEEDETSSVEDSDVIVEDKDAIVEDRDAIVDDRDAIVEDREAIVIDSVAVDEDSDVVVVDNHQVIDVEFQENFVDTKPLTNNTLGNQEIIVISI